jgi:hypothetical protein
MKYKDSNLIASRTMLRKIDEKIEYPKSKLLKLFAYLEN